MNHESYNKELQDKAAAIKKGMAEGYKLAEQLAEALTHDWFGASDVRALLKQITPDNVAYVFEKIPDLRAKVDNILGLNEDDFLEAVGPALVESANKAGLELGKAPAEEFAKAIRDKNRATLDDAEADVKLTDAVNSNLDKLMTEKETIDAANTILAEVANTEHPEVVKVTGDDGNSYEQVVLEDGRKVQITRDDEGHIEKVYIYFNEDESGKGLRYDSTGMRVLNDNEVQAGIAVRHNWEKILELANKIFGETAPAQ